MNDFYIMLRSEPLKPIEDKLSLTDFINNRQGVNNRLGVDLNRLVRDTIDSYDGFVSKYYTDGYLALSLNFFSNYVNMTRDYLAREIPIPLVIRSQSLPYVVLVHPNLEQDILFIPNNL